MINEATFSCRLDGETRVIEVDWEARAEAATAAAFDLYDETGDRGTVTDFITDATAEILRLQKALTIAIAAMGPNGVPPLPVEGIEEVGR